MTNIRRSRYHVLAPVALFGAALIVYLATLTRVHAFDALSYVTSVERKPWDAVLFPHHLAYGPIGKLALAAGSALGYTGGAALPMQLVSAVAGAMGVALFFMVTRRISKRPDLALVAAMLLGATYSYWYFAVETDVYALSTLCVLIWLDRLIRLIEQPARRNVIALALAHSAALLLHQAHILLLAPLTIVLLAQRGPDSRMNPATLARLWWPYPITGALAVGLPYLGAALASGFRSWNEFSAWISGYAQIGWWGGATGESRLAGIAEGLSDTLAQPDGGLVGLLLLGLAVLCLRRVRGSRNTIGIAMLTWLAVYAAFFIWWEPDNIKFWIASLPPALILLVLGLRHERIWGASAWMALGIVGLIATINYDTLRRQGDPATDLQRVIARELGVRSGPADLLLVPDGMQELYLPYYESHDNQISLNQALIEAGNWPAACRLVQARIDTSLHAGATALIADQALHPPELLLQRARIDQASIDSCFAPYRNSLTPLELPTAVPHYWRLPTGQERAEGKGWRFATSSEGWDYAHIEQNSFAEGWRFVPGSDPYLTSPLMNLEAPLFRVIEIRMAHTTRSNDAQLFYADASQQFDEARSIRWKLKSSGETVTYTLELRDAPGWAGKITRLRLDPVGAGDGGEMRIEAIRFIR